MASGTNLFFSDVVVLQNSVKSFMAISRREERGKCTYYLFEGTLSTLLALETTTIA